MPRHASMHARPHMLCFSSVESTTRELFCRWQPAQPPRFYVCASAVVFCYFEAFAASHSMPAACEVVVGEKPVPFLLCPCLGVSSKFFKSFSLLNFLLLLPSRYI